MDEIKLKSLLTKNGYLTLNELLVIIQYKLDAQYRYLAEINYKEFANLYKPCYKPSIRYSMDDMFIKIYGDKKNKILDSIGNNIIKTDKNFKLFKNRYTLFLIFSILVTRLDNNGKFALTFFQTLTLQFYASLFYKYIKYCDEFQFNKAYERLSKNHGFKKYQRIDRFLKKLALDIIKKYYFKLSLKNPKSIILLSFELRHRINQSLKALAKNYYEEDKIKIASSDEDNYELSKAEERDLINNIQKIIEKFLQDFQVMKELDKDLLKKINTNYHINFKYLINIMEELQNTELYEELKTILLKIININNINIFRKYDDQKFFKYVKQILSSRNLNPQKSIRYLIKKILEKLYTYHNYFLMKNSITRRRLENIVIIYLFYKIRSMF